MGKKANKKTNAKVAEGTRKTRRAAKVSVFTILSLVAVFLVSVAVYSITYASKTYANVYLGEVNYGGKNKQTVAESLKQRSEQFLTQKSVLKYKLESGSEKNYEILPSDIGLVYDIDESTSEVYGYGRNLDPWHNFGRQLLSLLKPYRAQAIYSVNTDAVTKKVADIAQELDIPEKDYNIVYAGEGEFSLETEKQTGKRIDQDLIIANINSQIAHLKASDVVFSINTYEPKVTESKARGKLAAADNILKAGELKLVYSDLNYTLDIDTIGGLVRSRPKGDDLELYLDQEKTQKQVEAIAGGINRAPQNAVLSATAGVVSAFQLSQEGRELDQKQTIIDIGNALLARATEGVTNIDSDNVKLTVKVTQPEISSASLEQYGLKELVATGTTDFRKSPSNRVHNITTGANAINGTLLKPGEEFSTLARLGKIDASSGYLPELVIKNNKTVPDYGGGLCQVSTTLFRTALNAGMKITSRRNHSYRVSYYEPPVGMDATIFDPSPDFKFVNNYDSHILIQLKMTGTKITFEFYGTKDTRTVTVGTPEVYDYVEPPAPVETVDPALAAGARNLVSHSHQGASAKFLYEVVRNGETLQKTIFTSKYVALPEMWAVGPAATPPVTPPADPAATPPA